MTEPAKKVGAGFKNNLTTDTSGALQNKLRAGEKADVIIGMEDLRARCIMTTFDPDSGQQDVGVLRRIQREFDGRLGLNSFVIAPGRIQVGDPVELLPA